MKMYLLHNPLHLHSSSTHACLYVTWTCACLRAAHVTKHLDALCVTEPSSRLWSSYRLSTWHSAWDCQSAGRMLSNLQLQGMWVPAIQSCVVLCAHELINQWWWGPKLMTSVKVTKWQSDMQCMLVTCCVLALSLYANQPLREWRCVWWDCRQLHLSLWVFRRFLQRGWV